MYSYARHSTDWRTDCKIHKKRFCNRHFIQKHTNLSVGACDSDRWDRSPSSIDITTELCLFLSSSTSRMSLLLLNIVGSLHTCIHVHTQAHHYCKSVQSMCIHVRQPSWRLYKSIKAKQAKHLRWTQTCMKKAVIIKPADTKLKYYMWQLNRRYAQNGKTKQWHNKITFSKQLFI